MKIGIFLKGDRSKMTERFWEAFNQIKEDREFVHTVRLSESMGEGLIITNKNNQYKLVRTGNGARGNRFHKSYFDANTTIEELECIIEPLTILGYQEGFKNTCELINV